MSKKKPLSKKAQVMAMLKISKEIGYIRGFNAGMAFQKELTDWYDNKPKRKK